MLITTVTTISFEMPKDHDELMAFREHANMNNWEERTAGPYITYASKPIRAWIDKLIYGGNYGEH